MAGLAPLTPGPGTSYPSSTLRTSVYSDAFIILSILLGLTALHLNS
jgi:hypothetical protein